jgi:SPP1 family predicted phage head-tail adaptor
MIAPKTRIADRPHRVLFQNHGAAVPDGQGGSTQSWTNCSPPELSVRLSPATAVDLERVAAGTVLSTNTYIVKGPYHPQVTTETRLLFNGRVFQVTGGGSPDERQVEMELVAVELLNSDPVVDTSWMEDGWTE